jgi:hypothetical protein
MRQKPREILRMGSQHNRDCLADGGDRVADNRMQYRAATEFDQLLRLAEPGGRSRGQNNGMKAICRIFHCSRTDRIESY